MNARSKHPVTLTLLVLLALCQLRLSSDGARADSLGSSLALEPGARKQLEQFQAPVGNVITAPDQPPTLTSITPDSGWRDTVVHITNLAGSDFHSEATVKLSRTGEADIQANDVMVVSPSQITCSLDLAGAATGIWDVVVTNPDTLSATLPSAFTVEPAEAVHLPVLMSNWGALPPAAPTDVDASDGAHTDRVRVTWNHSPGATFFEVYRALSSDGIKSKLGSPTGTSYDDTTASVGVTYYYWVKACNTYACSDFSTYDTGWRSEGLLAAPTLDPIDNADGDGDYTICWSAVDGATSYTLQEDLDCTFAGPTEVYSGSNTCVPITGQDDGKHCNRVKAANASGASDWSNCECVVVPAAGPIDYAGTTDVSTPISFTVASDFSGVSTVSLSVDFSCSGIGRSGTVRVTPSVAWPIVDESFNFEVKCEFVLTGALTSGFQAASGTWQGIICTPPPSRDEICRGPVGTWDAVRQP